MDYAFFMNLSLLFFFFLCVAGGRGVGPVLNSGLIVGSGMSEREGGEE